MTYILSQVFMSPVKKSGRQLVSGCEYNSLEDKSTNCVSKWKIIWFFSFLQLIGKCLLVQNFNFCRKYIFQAGKLAFLVLMLKRYQLFRWSAASLSLTHLIRGNCVTTLPVIEQFWFIMTEVIIFAIEIVKYFWSVLL